MVSAQELEHNPEMVMIFIDGPRFDRMVHALGVEVDYQKLIQLLVGSRELAGVMYFHHPGNINKDLRSKLTALNVQIIEDSDIKNLNKQIIFEIRSRRRELNHIVLVSGNSNFTSIIESSVISYSCSASVFCIEEQLYAFYKSLPIEIIDPKKHLNEIGSHRGDPEEVKLAEASAGTPRERVVIMVDAANLMAVLQKRNISIDFYALRRTLAAGRQIIASYYYHGTPAPLKRFQDYLVKVGYTMVHGKNSNVDPIIINHIRSLSSDDNIDTIILVSGDGDFLIELEKAVETNKVKVEVASFEEALFKPYLSIPIIKVTVLDDILSQIIRNRLEDTNGGEILQLDTAPAEASLPETEVVMTESPVVKPKRKVPTRAEQLVGSLKYFLTDGSIKEIHLVLEIKGKERRVDIV